jgi:hypothetical protein
MCLDVLRTARASCPRRTSPPVPCRFWNASGWRWRARSPRNRAPPARRDRGRADGCRMRSRSSPRSRRSTPQGTTIVWIEHVTHALLAVVSRLVAIDFGKIIGEGRHRRSWTPTPSGVSTWGSRHEASDDPRADAFYGDFQALYGIDLSRRRGRDVAIVGANGAGKTTLMGAITGQRHPARDDRIRRQAHRRHETGRDHGPRHRAGARGAQALPLALGRGKPARRQLRPQGARRLVARRHLPTFSRS